MDLGLALPTIGPATSPEAIRHTAVEAERMGLASVWVLERLLRPVRAAGGEPVPEVYANVEAPLETLAHIAALTTEITLGTSVLGALFHHPVVLARRLATVDRLSGGRLLAGLGQGWMEEEFALTGTPMTRRGAGFEEHIAAMRAVWGPDPVSFHGRFYSVPESQIGPRSPRPGGPRMLIGAKTAVAARRAGRLGIPLNPAVGFSSPFGTLEDLLAVLQAHGEAAVEAGHTPDRLPAVVRVNGPVTEGPLDGRAPLTGSVEQVCEDLAVLEKTGIGHVFWAMPLAPGEQLDAMRKLVAAR
ncbi:MAG TPA: TIGR03619 family F420-dependent LLM class oxidoreductase [Streptomyces sp.]|uniref:TIGR03619 family F420-dependent LLM class oxidoreductase n=1 Tax=Streptomyces sp. TaxID=1931 RepID=UPI002C03E1DE|nr:TIGR03619 family F420-dependent LLM class oxidoreductase [Streptomyces sp.]HWU11091.1 TIGR03619 family F420-dependent LLM class oxidoreductase [Streptomyces sp.]